MFDQFIKRNRESIEIYGTPVYFVDGMVRLKDIQMAYLNSEEFVIPKSHNKDVDVHRWRQLDTTGRAIKYLVEVDDFYETEEQVHCTPMGKKGGLYVCRELAHNYAAWVDPVYNFKLMRAVDHLLNGEYLNEHHGLDYRKTDLDAFCQNYTRTISHVSEGS